MEEVFPFTKHKALFLFLFSDQDLISHLLCYQLKEFASKLSSDFAWQPFRQERMLFLHSPPRSNSTALTTEKNQTTAVMAVMINS